jgi:hypothetical protein
MGLLTKISAYFHLPTSSSKGESLLKWPDFLTTALQSIRSFLGGVSSFFSTKLENLRPTKPYEGIDVKKAVASVKEYDAGNQSFNLEVLPEEDERDPENDLSPEEELHFEQLYAAVKSSVLE